MKPSDLYFVAALAVEKALPAESRALIEKLDHSHTAWSKAGYPAPVPDALTAAQKAANADPLAVVALYLGTMGATALRNESKAAATATRAPAESAA